MSDCFWRMQFLYWLITFFLLLFERKRRGELGLTIMFRFKRRKYMFLFMTFIWIYFKLSIIQNIYGHFEWAFRKYNKSIRNKNERNTKLNCNIQIFLPNCAWVTDTFVKHLFIYFSIIYISFSKNSKLTKICISTVFSIVNLKM